MRPRITSVGLIMPPRAACASDPAQVDRASLDLDALPARPGVYLFLDEARQPIYIGKSVNIRARVLSHLRAPEEAAMMQETRKVEFVRTAGEIGALLLESHLIKRLQPAFNVLLKASGGAYALRFTETDLCPDVVACSARDAVGPGLRHGNLYGLFPSRSAAEEELQSLTRRHGLCPALLGLEATTRGRACFSHQIGRCRGACVGKESPDVHRRRLQRALAGLQADAWPHAGPVGILERDENWRQVHVIDRWRYLGSLSGRQRKLRIPDECSIDMDIHRILARPMRRDELAIVPFEERKGFVYCLG